MNGSDGIDFTGLSFPDNGVDVSCMYEGVDGTVTSFTATSASCTFAAGVPAGNAAVASLLFTYQVSGVKLTSDDNG